VLIISVLHTLPMSIFGNSISLFVPLMRPLLVVGFFVVPLLASSATTPDTSSRPVREQCFASLKDDLREARIFDVPLAEMDTLTYATLETQFSRLYTGLSSFGIETDKAQFAMRVYDFGSQTGYVHPPYAPLPVVERSEAWATATKQFIIAEEYVIDPEGKPQFIDCAFLSIASDDLLQVTRERYSSDGPMASLLKTTPDASRKSWYSQNTSFDHSGNPLATWKRLFVYPSGAQNPYFDKYSVIEAFPAHKVDSFAVLGFFDQEMLLIEEYNPGSGGMDMTFLIQGEGTSTIEAVAPVELLPLVPKGADRVFPLASYYAGIESRFPQFAETLSIRGTLKYITFKELITRTDMNEESKKLLNALIDPRRVSQFVYERTRNGENGAILTDPEFEGLILAFKDADTAMLQLEQPNTTLENLKSQPIPVKQESAPRIDFVLLVVAGVFVCVAAGGLLVVIRKRKKSPVATIVASDTLKKDTPLEGPSDEQKL
jgi:hypothetical protein